jgi:hypothetical protein
MLVWCVYLFFRAIFLFLLYVRLACLHISLYHGARCFAHLFGLRFITYLTSRTTPIFMASRIRNDSICPVRYSLSSLYCSVISSNSLAKLSLFVCSLHCYILRMYSLCRPCLSTHNDCCYLLARLVVDCVCGWIVYVWGGVGSPCCSRVLN